MLCAMLQIEYGAGEENNMARLKKWLFVRLSAFMDVYAREKLLQEIGRLERLCDRQNQTIQQQRAYAAGLKESLKAIKRITINNEVG